MRQRRVLVYSTRTHSHRRHTLLGTRTYTFEFVESRARAVRTTTSARCRSAEPPSSPRPLSVSHTHSLPLSFDSHPIMPCPFLSQLSTSYLSKYATTITRSYLPYCPTMARLAGNQRRYSSNNANNATEQNKQGICVYLYCLHI